MNIFENIEAKDIKGREVQLNDYKGKTVLVVNTASQCGLTPQFEGLEKLYQQYQKDDFVILGFPCNQFKNQEPGNEDQILEACQLNYGVSFPMFSKVNVNGKDAHPLFKSLKKELPGLFGKNIKWNFTKFLIGPDGQPIKRFAPTTLPKQIAKHIEKTLP